MKNTIKSLAIAMLAIVSANGAFAQSSASASANANAKIFTPITLTNTADMFFGNNVPSGASGTVVLTPAGAASATGGVTHLSGGTVSAAAFTVTGEPSTAYTITLPSSATTLSSGSNSMTVSSWTSYPSGTSTLSSSGTEALTVGATLAVGASQAPGTYVSGTPFNITVNY
jgi:hypothetical protein